MTQKKGGKKPTGKKRTNSRLGTRRLQGVKKTGYSSQVYKHLAGTTKKAKKQDGGQTPKEFRG